MLEVRSLVGLWRGLRRGQVGPVADDAVTAQGLALGLCERVAPADRPADRPVAKPAAQPARKRKADGPDGG